MKTENNSPLRVPGGRGNETVPRYDEFEVPFEDGASVLDALIWLRIHRDPSLAIRYSCINGNVCKECTVSINGIVGYACTARLSANEMTLIEPLLGKRHLRDLATETRPPRERL